MKIPRSCWARSSSTCSRTRATSAAASWPSNRARPARARWRSTARGTSTRARCKFEIDAAGAAGAVQHDRGGRLGARRDLPLARAQRALSLADRHQLRRQLARRGVDHRRARRPAAPQVRSYLIDGARRHEVGRSQEAARERASRSCARAALAPTASSERFWRAAACRSCTPGGRSARPQRAPAQRRARSSPSTPKGELVKVDRGAEPVQAEFVQGLLLEEGIPSVLSADRRLRAARRPARHAGPRVGRPRRRAKRSPGAEGARRRRARRGRAGRLRS